MRVHRIFSIIVDALFSPQCASCDAPVKTNFFPICDNCTASLLPYTSLFCPHCGNRLPSFLSMCHKECAYILGAGTEFNTPVAQSLVHALKYKNRKYAATVMGKFIAEYFSRTFPMHRLNAATCIIVPVPTSRKHLRTRGYNQAVCIAREFALFSGISEAAIQNNIVIKARTTKSQTECVSVRERKENIKGSFAMKNGTIVRDKDIILIDDVHTTGATMRELSLLLKQNGARKILALVFAKT